MTGFPSPGRLRLLLQNPGKSLIGMVSRAEFQLLTRRARLAQRRKDWPSAANLWREATEKAPDDHFAAIACIGVLIYAGELDEATARTREFVRARPDDENGQIALARIAEAHGNTAEAIGHWRSALHRSSFHRQGLIRLGALLVAESELEQARACADILAAKYPAEPHAPVLLAQIAQRRHGFGAAAQLWRDAEQRFPKDISVLRASGRAALEAREYNVALAVAEKIRRLNLYDAIRLEGQVLAKREPHRDHAGFWKRASAQLPDNVDVTRKLVHAALSARRQDDAMHAFARLLQQRQLLASDADYVVGLGLSALQRNDRAAVRREVRRFLKELRGRPGYRTAALRLNRLILTSFPTDTTRAVAISRNPARFLRMVGDARLGSGTRDSLTKIARLEDNLASRGMCLLDTDIDAESCRAFIRLVREHLAGRKPFSLVRLGDGEANAFQQNSYFARQSEMDAAEREKVWWGRTLDDVARKGLSESVRKAALGADALGFPTREWFLRDVRLDNGAPLEQRNRGVDCL